MANGNTIDINDIAAFPAKVAAIESAARDLRHFNELFDELHVKAAQEASSFTTTGSPAPIYTDTLAGLGSVIDAFKPAISAVADSADHCAATLRTKYTGIVGTDDDSAATITRI